MIRSAHRWLLRLLGPILLVVLLGHMDLGWIWAYLADISLGLVTVAVLINVPVLFLRTQRWRALLEGRELSYRHCLKLYGGASLFGALTPGQVGELGKGWVLTKQGHARENAWWSTILDRVADLILLAVVFLAFGVFLLSGQGLATVLLAAAAFFAILHCGGFFLRLSHRPARGWRRFLPAPATWKQFCRANIWGWTLLPWLLNWFSIWLLARDIGLVLPFWYLAGTMAAAALAGTLPLTWLGLGTRDAVLIYFLGLKGIEPAAAVALSAIVLFLRLAYLGTCGLPAMLSDSKAKADF